MTEMSELIDEYFDQRGDFSIAVEIGGFQRWLREEHPAVLKRWLAQMERSFLSRAVTSHQRSRRASVQRRRLRTAVEDRDAQTLSEFEVRCSVGPENLWIRVGDMTAEHHLHAARRYSESGQRMLLLGAFHRAVAKQLEAGQKTSDVLTEEAYARLRSSITGQPGPVSLREALTRTTQALPPAAGDD